MSDGGSGLQVGKELSKEGRPIRGVERGKLVDAPHLDNTKRRVLEPFLHMRSPDAHGDSEATMIRYVGSEARRASHSKSHHDSSCSMASRCSSEAPIGALPFGSARHRVLGSRDASGFDSLRELGLETVLEHCVERGRRAHLFRSSPPRFLSMARRLPNYRVRMGFGLHSGWAIEGAIGSEFKIDASYLSPNVNMAARLEAITKQFGCLILLSDSLIRLMSEPIADQCRLIDHVKMVGTKEAFKLYTIDLDDLALEVDLARSGVD